MFKTVLLSLIFFFASILEAASSSETLLKEKKEEKKEEEVFLSFKDKKKNLHKIFVRRVLTTDQQRIQGLSGLRPHEFGEREGALFLFPRNGLRQFWMPDTYFDLDIIYLDHNLKILHIDRNIPHHPGRQEPIPRASSVYARHVLEIKAQTSLSKKLEKDLVFSLNRPEILLQIK